MGWKLVTSLGPGGVCHRGLWSGNLTGDSIWPVVFGGPSSYELT